MPKIFCIQIKAKKDNVQKYTWNRQRRENVAQKESGSSMTFSPYRLVFCELTVDVVARRLFARRFEDPRYFNVEISNLFKVSDDEIPLVKRNGFINSLSLICSA